MHRLFSALEIDLTVTQLPLYTLALGVPTQRAPSPTHAPGPGATGLSRATGEPHTEIAPIPRASVQARKRAGSSRSITT